MILQLLVFWYLQWTNANAVNELEIRVASYNTPPSMIIHNETGNITYSGVNYDVLVEMFRRLKLPYRFVHLRDGPGSQLPRLIQQVINDEVDICTYGFVATPERAENMDFSIVVEIDYYRFLLRYPERQSRLLGLIRPFQPAVWAAFIIILLLLVFAFTSLMIFQRDTHSNTTFQTFLHGNVLYIVAILASQGGYVPSKRLSVRLLVGIWCLMAVIFINSYTGNLTSYLAVPKLKPIPNSFEELATSSDYKISAHPGKLIEQEAKSGPYKILGDFLRSHPEYMVRKYSDLFTNTLEKKAAQPLVDLVGSFVLNDDLTASGKCRLTLSKKLSLSQSSGYIYPKNNPFRTIIDVQLQRFWENGLLEKIRENYRPRIDKCLLGANNPTHDVLYLIDLSSAFFLYGIGLCASLVSFFLEMAIGKGRFGRSDK